MLVTQGWPTQRNALNPDLVCLSHLRWNFVYQRPQHLLSRFARSRRVFYVEEPVALPRGECSPRLDMSLSSANVRVVVPRLPAGVEDREALDMQQEMLTSLFTAERVAEFVLW